MPFLHSRYNFDKNLFGFPFVGLRHLFYIFCAMRANRYEMIRFPVLILSPISGRRSQFQSCPSLKLPRSEVQTPHT